MKRPNNTFDGISFSDYQKINKLLKEEYVPEEYVNIDDLDLHMVAQETDFTDYSEVTDQILDTVDDVTFFVLNKRFGLRQQKTHTLYEIATSLNFKSAEKGRQLEAKALMDAERQLEVNIANKKFNTYHVLSYYDQEQEKCMQLTTKVNS